MVYCQPKYLDTMGLTVSQFPLILTQFTVRWKSDVYPGSLVSTVPLRMPISASTNCSTIPDSQTPWHGGRLQGWSDRSPMSGTCASRHRASPKPSYPPSWYNTMDHSELARLLALYASSMILGTSLGSNLWIPMLSSVAGQ